MITFEVSNLRISVVSLFITLTYLTSGIEPSILSTSNGLRVNPNSFPSRSSKFPVRVPLIIKFSG